MELTWQYCTLTESAEGDAIHAEVEFHRAPARVPTETRTFNHAGEGLYHLGLDGWELVGVHRETTQQHEPEAPPARVMTLCYLKRSVITPGKG